MVAVRVKVGVGVFVGVEVKVGEGVKLGRINSVPVAMEAEVGSKTPGVIGVAGIYPAGVGVQVWGKVKTVAVLVGTVTGGGKVGG